MQPEASNSTQSNDSRPTSQENGTPESVNLCSNNIQESPLTEEQNLRGDARHDVRRRRSRRRGRRRGRRRRRGLQRARARARAREEVQNAVADLSEDMASTSEDGSDSEDNWFRYSAGTGSSRSRSPRRQRSLDNDDILRRGIVGIRPTLTPPTLSQTPCRVPNCDWSGPLEDAANHARAAHEDAVLRGARQRLSVPLAFAAYTRYWRLIDAYDELFLVQFRRRAGGRRRLQAAVQLIGPASRAARFLYMLHMQVVEPENQQDPYNSTLPPRTNISTSSLPSTTHISLVLGRTSCTRADLEPAMISLWSAHNFSRPDTSLESASLCGSSLQGQDNDDCTSIAAPRVLDLTLSIQQIIGQKE